MDRTKWYRVNHEVLDAIADSPSCKICPMDSANHARPIPEINTEDNNGKKETWVLTGLSPDNPTTKPSCVSVPIVEKPNKEISEFIGWYFSLYWDTYGEAHPNIKSEQRIRVTETLAAFVSENDLDTEALQEMAYAFFNNVECTDHNINHFATYGILVNRYFESCY